MRHLVFVADLAKMDQRRKDGALDDLVRRARSGKPNGSLTALDAQIRAFETRYEMSSEKMLARFQSGKQPDTADISHWMMLLSVRHRAQAPEAKRRTVVVDEPTAEAQKLGVRDGGRKGR